MAHDTNRAEILALCMALELHPEASYERPQPAHGRRTPDWLLHMPNGRLVAMEVTSKWTYENWKMSTGITTRVGLRSKGWKTGDTQDLRRTLHRERQGRKRPTASSGSGAVAGHTTRRRCRN